MCASRRRKKTGANWSHAPIHSSRIGDRDGAVVLREQIRVRAQVARPHVDAPKVAAAAVAHWLPAAEQLLRSTAPSYQATKLQAKNFSPL